MWFFLVGFLLLLSCSPSSMEDYYHEGQALTAELIKDLKPVQSREELEKKLPLLKKRFEALVELIISAKKFQEKHQEEYYDELEYAYSLDDALLEEMKRIYQLEKGRELMEKAQREALLRLDAFKRRQK